METNYELYEEIKQAFAEKCYDTWEITEVGKDTIRYYSREDEGYICWGVKYTYIEGKLEIDWQSAWNPGSPSLSFKRPVGDVII
jgi:hypothetical protein